MPVRKVPTAGLSVWDEDICSQQISLGILRMSLISSRSRLRLLGILLPMTFADMPERISLGEFMRTIKGQSVPE